MCGILGAIGKGVDGIGPAGNEALAALAHRGPDAQKVWTAAGVFLGHRRLSILDLDARAHQPMSYGPLTIVFNGEIYNYRDLRRALEAEGEKFTTSSDTEVLLAGLVKQGVAFLNRVEGMFAFATYDSRDRSLLLARDRYGEKPLFVHNDTRQISFASEMGALEMLVGDPLEEDASAIALYFRLSYVPAPFAALRNVSQVEPGTWRRYDSNLQLKSGEYYRLPPARAAGMSFEDAVVEVRSKLTSSIDLRLKTADVPVATLLSGGLDSTIVTLVASQVSDRPVTAYSLSFPDDPAFDEGEFATKAARNNAGVDHRLVPATVADLLAFIDRIFEGLSEPLADASLLPTAYLMSHISEKVVLGGDGADEIFAGYGSYASMHASAKLPRALHQLLRSLPSHPNPARIQNPMLRAAALFHSNLGASTVEEYLLWRSYARRDDLQALGLDVNAAEILKGVIGGVSSGSLRDIQAVDIAFNLPNDMLRKVDIAGMMFGIEARLPYLDSDLVHFALSLPDDFRISGNVRKRVLRAAFSNIVPEEILTRRKMGFLMPIRRWMKQGPMKDALCDLNRSQYSFDRTVVERLIEEHGRGIADHSVLLWALLVYFRWQSSRAGRKVARV